MRLPAVGESANGAAGIQLLATWQPEDFLFDHFRTEVADEKDFVHRESVFLPKSGGCLRHRFPKDLLSNVHHRLTRKAIESGAPKGVSWEKPRARRRLPLPIVNPVGSKQCLARLLRFQSALKSFFVQAKSKQNYKSDLKLDPCWRTCFSRHSGIQATIRGIPSRV